MHYYGQCMQADMLPGESQSKHTGFPRGLDGGGGGVRNWLSVKIGYRIIRWSVNIFLFMQKFI